VTGRDTFAAVVNPVAGSGAAAARMLALARALREAGAEVRVSYSRGLAHATDLAAAAAADGAAVLAVGGDGLVGAVAAGLAGTAADLGVVPAGRGNDLARAVPPPTAVAAFAEALRTAPARTVDVIDLGGRTVVGSVCLSLDPVVFVPRRPLRFDLTLDGEPETFVGHAVVIANSLWRLDDGRLDVVTVGALPRRRLPRVLAALRRGGHLDLPGIDHRPARRVTVDTRAPARADGEALPAGPVTATVRPRVLRLIRP
jgi:diacylglycerol kinase family enzyme